MLITLLSALLGGVLGAFLDDPLLYGVLGFLAGRVIDLGRGLDALEKELVRVRRALSADRGVAQRPALKEGTGVSTSAEPATKPIDRVRRASASDAVSEDGLELTLEPEAVTWPRRSGALHPRPSRGVPGPGAQVEHRPDLPPESVSQPALALLDRFRDWLQSGNLFVRVGILLLFFGVGFLIKYAVEKELLLFTMEMRLAAVAAGGLFLLGLGWFLRGRRREYALLLQGAAVGILYLDVYGGFELYHLIPAGLAFTLLALVALLAAGLAVVQDARSLAWFGFAGGFLAPLIASSGSNNYVALFAYYALLNGAILAVAWFRSWRALNLLGFAFTYGVAGMWGALRYEPSRFVATEPFLALFFLFYVTIAVLYAVRQPPRLRGYIDATLVFGTPLLTFAYQMKLVGHFAYGIAWSAFAMGAFYLALAWLSPRLGGKGLKLLSQAFLALGVVFLSVAIPFALAAEETAGFWALEGAGLVWVGVRQGRLGARAFGLLLQAGAAVALMAGYPFGSSVAFLNGLFLGASMIALAGFSSGYWMDGYYRDKQAWERGGAPLLLLWALVWWFGAGSYELLCFYSAEQFPAAILVYASVTVLVAEGAASRWPWGLLNRVETAMPLSGIAALAASVYLVGHPAQFGGAWAWPLFFAACYLVLFRVEGRDRQPTLPGAHGAAGLLLTAVLQWEVLWRLLEHHGLRQGWRAAAFPLIPVILLQLVTRLGGWPLARWRFAYGVVLGGVLAALIFVWGIWSLASPGGSAPLPWVPLLNPVDIMLALGLVTLFQWWTGLRGRLQVQVADTRERFAWMSLGGLAFLGINAVLLRAMHHWWGVPYEADVMFRYLPAQTAVSVLWGLTGVGLLLAATSRHSRGIWIAGAVTLAAVVLKLLLIDLAARGTLERIVSFLAVGGLLVGIGWFAPLPPRGDRASRPVRDEGRA